jgi:hypothetical protein
MSVERKPSEAADLTAELLDSVETVVVHTSKCDGEADSFLVSFEESKQSLAASLEEWCQYFLSVCGMMLMVDDFSLLSRLWSVVVLGLVGFCYLYGAVYLVSGRNVYRYAKSIDSHIDDYVSIPLAVSLLFQGVGIFISTYYNSKRLVGKGRNYEPTAFSKHLWSGVWLVAVLIFVSVPQLLIVPPYLVVTYFGPSLVLAGNIYFLIVDTSVCQRTLRNCIAAAETDRLTTDMINTARTEVASRVRIGFIANSAIMATALVNVLAIFVIALIAHIHPLDFVLYVVSFMLREVIVAAIGLYNVALVNEEYDRLVYRVGIASQAANSLSAEKKLDNCVMLNLIIACPIHFPIVGMTLRRKDVLLRFSIWLFGILLSTAGQAL